ncbi:hypothetical protein AAG906_009094 [Vitis piasezkii]
MAIDENLKTCVVFGGRGFIGRFLVLRLLKLGKWIVRVADSAQSLQLDPTEDRSVLSEAISSGRASCCAVDVRDKAQVRKAIEGASVVFYMDPTITYTNDFYLCYMIIVQGVRNVINACQECKVKRLIYNSSADVVFDGSHDIYNGDESLPCPWKFEDMLTDIKAQAEGLVLIANNIDGLVTCALRPCNVFGPGDKQLVPFLVNKAKSGHAKFVIGSGENMSDFTYVENVAHAHVCAEEALVSRMVSVAGKVFFITNLEPVKFWEFVSLILEGLGYQRPLFKLPAGMVLYVLSLVEWMRDKLDFRSNHPVSAQYVVQIASRTRTFNCSAAQKHIGYSPVVSLEEGVTLTTESFSQLSQDSSVMAHRDFDEQSKVDKLLGGGKVADILLWRDEKKTFTCFLALFLMFYWFFLCGRTFISSAAKLLLLVTAILSGQGILPTNIFGFSIQRISLSCFEISETVVNDLITNMANLWNNWIHMIRLLAGGGDWNTFFKVAIPLYFLKLILSQCLTLVVGVALVLAFTSFFVYEQYEEEMDGLAEVLFDSIKKSKRLLMRNLPAPLVSFLCNRDALPDDEGFTMAKSQ